MRFSRKVNNPLYVFLRKYPFNKRGISYITMDKAIPFCLVRSKVFEVGRVACIGKRIQINDTPIRPDSKGMANEVCADKASAACNKIFI